MKIFSSLIAGTLALWLSSPALADGTRTMIVMDGSGSMWGQIDGRAKLEIARDTVADVLGQIPADQELGLIAYGHRRKGDCSDIEVMVQPSAGTGPQISDRVNAMRFLGKTPLSQAVRQAAEALRYDEAAATVVLVTDGLETCDADPCALGRELEATGLNFTTHVIGFGLTRDEGAQVACLAETTGGRYIEARNAADLAVALGTTIAAAPPLEPTVETAPPPLPTAGLIAPDQAPLGTMVAVEWSVSESNAYDTITIGRPDEDGYIYYVYASQNPVNIQMPGETGSFELRYVSADRTIVHRRAIEVTDAPLSLDAPDQVVAGQLFPVYWQGPDAQYDNILLQRPGEGSYITYEYVAGNNPITLRAPEEVGPYELVYKLNDANPIITRKIEVLPLGSTVAPLPASLTAPDTTEAGEEFFVGWSGPGTKADYIYLRDVGADERSYISYGKVADGNPVTLIAPAEAGVYELAYMFGDEQSLTTQQITVVAADVVGADAVLAEKAAELTLPDAANLPIPVVLTIEAEGAADLFFVQWSATPTADNLLAAAFAPEAWAMPEALMGVVTLALLPRGFDVLGVAGDQVFAGRIDVALGGESRFIIPYDPTRSPAGEDSVLSTNGPVPIQISGEWGDMLTRWQATPASGQNSLILGTNDFQTTPWDTALDHGRWLIEGYDEGSDTALYAQVIDVTADSAPQIILPRTAPMSDTPVMLPTKVVAEAHCVGEVACYHTDTAMGVGYLLLPEWAASAGYGYSTASGVVASSASVEFYTGVPFEMMAALNPRQWDASLGPCRDTEAGNLCAVTGADPAAIALLENSLKPAKSAPLLPGTAPPRLSERMTVDTPLAIPDGLNPVEFFAPAFLEKE